MKLPEKDSLYFFIGGKYLLKGGKITCMLFWTLSDSLIDNLMLTVYEKMKDIDGFLYIVYTEETTLGGEEGQENQNTQEKN